MKKQKLLTSLAIIGIASALNAQLAYDGFQTGTDTANGEYAVGVDIDGTTNGGTGWTDASWSDSGDSIQGTATGLTYSDGTNSLVTTPGAAQRVGGGDASDPIRALAQPAVGDELWFSAILDGSSLLVSYESPFQFAFFTSTNDLKYAIESQGGSRGWYATYNPNGSAAVTTQIDPTNLSLDDGATFFVGQVTNFNNGSADSVMSIWYNPSDLTSLGSASITSAAFDSSGYDEIRLVTGGNRQGIFDEIRVGTSFADVAPIPEPSSYAMISGLLALGWILLRRR